MPCHMLTKQDLTVDLEICALSQSLTHCINSFDSSSFGSVLLQCVFILSLLCPRHFARHCLSRKAPSPLPTILFK